MNRSSQKKKQGISHRFYCQKKIKNIISYTFWLVFKIVESLHCILKWLFKKVFDEKVKSCFSKFVSVMVNISLIKEAAVVTFKEDDR